MTEYRRCYRPGACYFFTVVTQNRCPILVENIDRLRRAFRIARARYPFDIDAIAVMPEHLHVVMRLPVGDADYSKRWMVIKRLFSAGLQSAALSPSMASKREKGIWQRRFWEHCIRDEADWRRHIDYVHFNPVKHGHVLKASDWPYSSFRQAVKRGWYEPDWAEAWEGLAEMELE